MQVPSVCAALARAGNWEEEEWCAVLATEVGTDVVRSLLAACRTAAVPADEEWAHALLDLISTVLPLLFWEQKMGSYFVLRKRT